MTVSDSRYVFLVLLMIALRAATAQAQPATRRPTIEKTGDHQFRLAQIRIDTAKREVAVTGHINDVTLLEFVANTMGGFKAYESAMTLDADGVTFNTALLLIGL